MWIYLLIALLGILAGIILTLISRSPTKADWPWYDHLGGRKFTALLLGIILPQWLVIALAFHSRTEMAFSFATFFCGATVGGILVYCGANVIQKIKTKNSHPEGG